MPDAIDPAESRACDLPCPGASMDALNRDCFCVAVEPEQVRAEVARVLDAHGLSLELAQSRPHLFSQLPVFVAPGHIRAMAGVVAALETVASLPGYREAVLAHSPAIARIDPGSPGGLLGLDFHLGGDGPRLIEINTNPGGVLINALLARAQRICMPEHTAPPTDVIAVEETVIAVMLDEWRSQGRTGKPSLLAIVDVAPQTQYLYPEFLLFHRLLERAGIPTVICDPSELQWRDGRLIHAAGTVDFAYNRLTDFDLAEPAHAALREAYVAGAVVLSPHPRAHALLADKRNLVLLGDAAFLRGIGASDGSVAALAAGVPTTVRVTDGNRQSLWDTRRQWFFKPAAGFGSKAGYRGDKITHRVWADIAAGEYVAQALVPPSQRHPGPGDPPLKVDLRCYAYRGVPILYAARMYQGQTTNFRTPGGGFAAVLTERMPGVAPGVGGRI